MALRALLSLVREDEGADTFEYLLVTGAIITLIALGLFGLAVVIPEVLGTSCSTVDPIGFANAEQCVIKGP